MKYKGQEQYGRHQIAFFYYKHEYYASSITIRNGSIRIASQDHNANWSLKMSTKVTLVRII